MSIMLELGNGQLMLAERLKTELSWGNSYCNLASPKGGARPILLPLDRPRLTVFLQCKC